MGRIRGSLTPLAMLRALRGIADLREIARSLLGPLRRISARRPTEDPALIRRLEAIAPAETPRDGVAMTNAPLQSDSEDGEVYEGAVPAGGWQIHRPSAFGAAILAVAVAVAFVGLLSYYGARKFTGDAADTRAAQEGQSLAAANAYTATGEAFNAYLQMLEYSEHPAIASRTSTPMQRLAAMAQFLILNTNKMHALAAIDVDGNLLATTDPAITDVSSSEAMNRTRASHGPTNSDIILPQDGASGYVEFTTPIKDADGMVWGFLYGRAEPDVLWRTTLRSSVDGSRNVILNSQGLFAAGVPEEQLRQPWRGAPLDNGSVQANIVGVDSICGLGLIGRDSQIDHGWHVASCLPTSLIQTEAKRAMGQQLLVTSAGAVLAIVLAAGLLRFALDGGPTPAAQEEEEPEEETNEAPDTDETSTSSLDAVGDSATEDVAPLAEPPRSTPEPAPTPEPAVVVVADVEATRLIDAYERRAARVADQLRESVQARLMIAATQAAEAFRIAADLPERAAELHASAMTELDAVRASELRSLAQQMHPALVRLGLPAALRSLAKEFDGVLAVDLDVDASVDAVRGGEGRFAVDPARRLAVFRAVRGAFDALVEAGATACSLSLARNGERLHVRITADVVSVDPEQSAADVVSFEAYGGRLTWSSSTDAGTELVGELPAPASADEPDESGLFDADSLTDESGIDDGERDAPIITFAAPLVGPGESLAASLHELALELAEEITLTVTVEDDGNEPGLLPGNVSGELRTLAGVAARAMAAAGAPSCQLNLQLEDGYAVMAIHAPTAVHDISETTFDASRDAIEALGGTLSVGAEGGEATVVASVPASAIEEDPPAVVRIERVGEPDAA